MTDTHSHYSRQPLTWRSPSTSRAVFFVYLAATPFHPAIAQSGTIAIGVTDALLVFLVALLVPLLWIRLLRDRGSPYAYLYRTKGNKLGKVTKLVSNVNRIGRHPNNEVQINDKTISRFHAELVRHDNGSFSIYDKNSKNGIRVGSRAVRSSVLRDGDLIDIGNTQFKFTQLPRDYSLHGDTVIQQHVTGRFEARRRLEQRGDLTTPVRLYNDDIGWINGRIRNIGRDGAFIESDVQFDARLPLDLVITAPDGDKRKWWHLAAETVWSDARGVGICFTDQDRSVLDEIMARQNLTRPGDSVLH